MGRPEPERHKALTGAPNKATTPPDPGLTPIANPGECDDGDPAEEE